MDNGAARNAMSTLEERIEWYESEIERLKEVCAEQDRRAGTTTARFQAVVHKGPHTFIVTCPAGDEYALMRMMFAGIAAMSWTAFSMAAESLGCDSIHDAADRLFGTGARKIADDDDADGAKG